jgi:hypothetical protein
MALGMEEGCMVRFGVVVLAVIVMIGGFVSAAPMATGLEPALGIALEGVPYPYPVAFLTVTIEGEELRLAYMDAAPTRAPTAVSSCYSMAATFNRTIGSPRSRPLRRPDIASWRRISSASASRRSRPSTIIST